MLDKIRVKIASKIAGKSLSLTDPYLANFYNGMYSLMSTPGQPVYSDISPATLIQEGYKIAIPVYRGVRSLVQAVSGVPWKVLDKNGEELENHHFTRVWSHPNSEFSGQDNMEYIIAHLALCGDAYLRPFYSGKIPQEYWIELPHQIAPIPSSNRVDWIAGYEYTHPDGHKTREPKEAFIHFRQMDPGNLYKGLGSVQVAGKVIDTYNESIDTRKVSMQNRGTPSGIFRPTEPLLPEQLDKAKEKINNLYLQKTQRGEPWVLSHNLEWIPTGLTPAELDYNQSELQLISQIASAIGVDPWWMGLRQFSSYNNVQEARRSLYEDAGLPMLDDIKATLNLKIAPLYGEVEIVYDTSNIPALREDYGAKVNQTQVLWQMGVPFSQINDKLKLGFDEFEGWDKSYLPFSVAPQDSPSPESGEKSIDPEGLKTLEWKRVDTRKRGWEKVVSKKFTELFEGLGKSAAKIKPDPNPDVLRDKVQKTIDKQSEKFEDVLSSSYLAVIEDFGTQTALNLKSVKSEVKFDPFASYVREWVARETGKKITTIFATQVDKIIDIISVGLETNLSNDEIASSISKFYKDHAESYALRIARTETAAAASYGQETAAREMGFGNKRWLSSRDDRVRDDHIRMDGETVPIDSIFSNGCEAPGIGDDPAEVINCRCTLQFAR